MLLLGVFLLGAAFPNREVDLDEFPPKSESGALFVLAPNIEAPSLCLAEKIELPVPCVEAPNTPVELDFVLVVSV